MPKNNQEIINQKEKEKQANNNHKFKLNKINMNKISKKESIVYLEKYNNSRMNNVNDNINLNKNYFKQEINHIDSNNIKGINNENLIGSEIYIVDDNDNIEKPPNSLEINDLIGEKCELNLNNLFKDFENYEPSKISSKTIGIIKAYAVNTYQGIVRNYNEDRVSIIINMTRPKNYTKKYWPKISFFGIYDGHGGSKCSEFLKNCLHKLILNDINFPENVELAIKNGFLNAEKTFLNEIALNQEDENIINDRSGSCAVIILLVDRKIYVANIGDSRTLFSEKNGKSFVMVTEDHKPENKNEKERIIKNGGHVYQSRTVLSSVENEYLNGKIFLGPFRVLPGTLSVSRTIGDIGAKNPKFGGNPNVVICKPDIFVFDLIKNDIDFFIMGSDGIFDEVSNEEIINCAWTILNNNNKDNKNFNKNENEYDFENINIHEKCGLIVDYIIKSSMVRKSLDNVTCLMIALKDFIPKEKEEHKIKFNLIGEYRKNIFNLNKSMNNLTNSQVKKSINNEIKNNNNKKSQNIYKLNQQNISEIHNNVHNSVAIYDTQKINLNNKINKNNSKEIPKKSLKFNFKLNNFLNKKNNNLQNIQNEFLTSIYRNTDTDILRQKNYNMNSKTFYNNRVIVKKIKDGNPRHKRINKTKINNLQENFNNSNIINKKKVSKIDIQEEKRPISNSISKQNMVNQFQEKNKETSNNKVDLSKSQNNLSNDMLSLNKKNKSSINNNLIQKLQKNKINKMNLKLNKKLINQNNLNNSNNSLNDHFYYNKTYSNISNKYLKTNSNSNIPNIKEYNNHLTTTHTSLNSINSHLRPKKFKIVGKTKLFRYNNTCLNDFKRTFYKNIFFTNREKNNNNNSSNNLNNINTTIIYSQNFKVKIKSKKDSETMISWKTKYSFNKIIKTLGINTENPFKNEINQLSNEKISYSKEKDIKCFLHKNKTNIVSGQNENNNNKNTLEKII